MWLAAVKDLCQLLICASRAFDLLSAQVELLRAPLFAADPQANTLLSLHIIFFFAAEELVMLKVRKRRVNRRGGEEEGGKALWCELMCRFL